MAQYLNPFSGRQFLDANGNPYVGAKLFTYVAGSSTKVTTTKDSAGVSNHLNPIVLNARGEPADVAGASQAIWQTGGAAIKIVLAPANDIDPPLSAISTWDNLSGINDTSVTIDQWITGPTPTFVSGTQFTLVGDQTTNFHVGRRIKATVTAGTVYGVITVSAYTTLTTITVVLDSGALDSGLSAIAYGTLTSVNPSIPGVKLSGNAWTFQGAVTNDSTVNHKGVVTLEAKALWQAEGAAIASAATTNIWTTDGNYHHLTGSATITSFGTAQQAGATKHITADGASTITDNANIICPGNANILCAVDDEFDVIADSTTVARITNYTRADGSVIQSAAACVTGFVRQGHNYCRRETAETTVTWVDTAACTGRTTGMGLPATAKSVRLGLRWVALSSGVAGTILKNQVSFFNSATCAAGAFHSTILHSVYEFSAVAAGTIVGDHTSIHDVPLVATDTFYATQLNNGINGNAAIDLFHVLGYFD